MNMQKVNEEKNSAVPSTETRNQLSAEPLYVVCHAREKDLYRSLEDGWVPIDKATRFTQGELNERKRELIDDDWDALYVMAAQADG